MPDEQVPPTYGYPGTPWQPPAWPQPPAWQQPPAKRTRTRAVVTGAIVALATALIAGSAGYELGVHHSQISASVQNFKAAASGPCPAGETQPALSATSPAGTALLAQMLPVPPGDTQVTTLKQGVLSLRDYLNELYSGNSTEQDLLVARCFQTAVHRTWQTPSGTTISVWLIQFGTRADARSYTLALEQADAASLPTDTAKFTVAGVADGMGLADPTLDKYGNALSRLLGDAGNTSIIIHVYIPGATNNAATSQVLQAQNARLSASVP